MNTLRTRLPALNGLVTFEAAARHLSFSLAAEELCVSQAAVSRQIKRLEDRLNQPLFHRTHRALTLTNAGVQLHHAVTMGLEHIATVTDKLMQAPEGGRIQVTTTLAFAYFWLAPRLNEFRKHHPEIDVHVMASDRHEDAFRQGSDIALTCGDKHPAGKQAHYLFSEVVYPVCSPDYLKRIGKTRITLADLPDLDLLHLDHSHWRDIGWEPIDWPLWLTHCGHPPKQALHGFSLNNYPMLVQTTLDGEGIALGWKHLVGHLLRTGRLIRPVQAEMNSNRGYFLVTNRESELRTEVRQLRDWLLVNNK